MKNRSRKFIRTDVQLRVILTALAVAGVVLFINFCLVMLCLSSTQATVEPGASFSSQASALRMAITLRFLLSIGIGIPVAGALGVFYSFRFAGPIYSIQRYFKGLESQPWDRRCSIRKGDDLQDVCTSINTGMDTLRVALRESCDLCAQLQRRIQSGEIGSRDGSAVDLRGLQERAMNLESLLRQKLPNDCVDVAKAELPDVCRAREKAVEFRS